MSWNEWDPESNSKSKGQPLREAVSWNAIWQEVWGLHKKSASSWGCELKFPFDELNQLTDKSASSWGCELKYLMRSWCSLLISSASSWGCELKCLYHVLLGRCARRQPLREAVSWNVIADVACVPEEFVSLFVRLWVEMRSLLRIPLESLVSLFVRLWVEIVFPGIHPFRIGGQPLREAVSWNIQGPRYYRWRFSSASSWGCELKSPLTCNDLVSYCVSLFVRLWVEMVYWRAWKWAGRSASSWGCELKSTGPAGTVTPAAVSLFVRLWVEIWPEITWLPCRRVSLFVRLWVEIPFARGIWQKK